MRVDKYVLAVLNKRNVLEVIRMHGPINRSKIAKMVGLSIPTIMKITDEFIENELVRVAGIGESKGGKKPQMLEIIPEAHYVVGVDIGRTTMKVIVMDLAGTVVSEGKTQTGKTLPAENLIHRLLELIQKTINSSQKDKDRILGMGIGMPGLLDTDEGVVLFSPNFEWENVQLISHIKKHFNMEIRLENSNRALAMGETWFGIGVDSAYTICVNLGYGIGSAIVERGRLYKGNCGSSGEIGHITLEKDGPLCACGNKGCLEALASGNAIANQAKSFINQGDVSMMSGMVNGDIAQIDAKMVFDAAKAGDILAKEIVELAIEYIGIGIASYVNILDPDLIIVAGGLVDAGSLLTDGIRDVVKRRQMKYAGRKVKIKPCTLGFYGTAIGAASLILKAFIESGGCPQIEPVD